MLQDLRHHTISQQLFVSRPLNHGRISTIKKFVQGVVSTESGSLQPGTS